MSNNFKSKGKDFVKKHNANNRKKFTEKKQEREREFNPSVEVRNGDVNKAIRILKKRLERADFQKELAKQSYYEKGSVKRKRKKDQAKKRWQKFVRDAELKGEFKMYRPTGTKWMKCKRKKRKYAQYMENQRRLMRQRGLV